MKILQAVLFKTTASGPTTVLKPIIERLNNKGHKVDVFSTLEFSSERKDLVSQLGGDYYFLEESIIKNTAHLIKKIPSLKSYDLVHIHGVYNINHVLLARLLKKNNIPYIISTHGGLMEEALKKSKYKKKIAINFLIKNMIAQASAIHALNKNEARSIAKIYKHNNIEIIHNGVYEESFNKTIDDFNHKKFNLLFIGRIDSYHKGLDILLDALENEKFKDLINLYLVGPYLGEANKEYIENRMSNSKVLKNIVNIEGPKYADEKTKYYREADFFIHTSRHEGMPMAVLEAMSAGIPVIVTPGTNMVEIIKESSGGLNVDFDKKSIKKTIDKATVLTKEDLFEMGNKAKKYCQTELSWDTIIEEYEKMYQELL